MFNKILFYPFLLLLITSSYFFNTPSFAFSYDEDDTCATELYPGGQCYRDGLYLLAQIGYSRQDFKKGTKDAQLEKYPGTTHMLAECSDEEGFAGRLALGYSLNTNFGFEFGVIKLTDAEWRLKTSGAVASKKKVCYSTLALDLLAKFTLPLSKRLSVYTKAGGAYVYVKTDAKKSTIVPKGAFAVSASRSDKKVRPELALGIAWDATADFIIDLSYARIFGQEEVTEQAYIPDIDTALVGFTYYLT